MLGPANRLARPRRESASELPSGIGDLVGRKSDRYEAYLLCLRASERVIEQQQVLCLGHPAQEWTDKDRVIARNQPGPEMTVHDHRIVGGHRDVREQRRY